MMPPSQILGSRIRNSSGFRVNRFGFSSIRYVMRAPSNPPRKIHRARSWMVSFLIPSRSARRPPSQVQRMNAKNSINPKP